MADHNITIPGPIAAGDRIIVTVGSVPTPTPVPPTPPPVITPLPPTNLSAALAALPAGGTAVIPAAAYTLTAPIVTKVGQRIEFRPGVSVNGAGIGRWIDVPANDVTLDLGTSVWRGCNNPNPEQGAIYVAPGALRTRITGGDLGDVVGSILRAGGMDGTYDGLDIHGAGHLGIHFAMGVRNQFVSRTRTFKLHDNSTTTGTSGHESGGAKGVGHRGIVFDGLHVYSNKGPGIWTDSVPPYLSYDISIRNSKVWANAGAGLFLEITDGVIAEDNACWDNGGPASLASSVAFDWGNITVASSRRVRVRRNAVRGGRAGINVFAQARNDAPGSALQLFDARITDIHVYDNWFIALGDWIAMAWASDTASVPLFGGANDATNNRFRYPGAENASPRFAAGGGYRSTLAQLRAAAGGLMAKGDTRYMTAAERATVDARFA